MRRYSVISTFQLPPDLLETISAPAMYVATEAALSLFALERVVMDFSDVVSHTVLSFSLCMQTLALRCARSALLKLS